MGADGPDAVCVGKWNAFVNSGKCRNDKIPTSNGPHSFPNDRRAARRTIRSPRKLDLAARLFIIHSNDEHRLAGRNIGRRIENDKITRNLRRGIGILPDNQLKVGHRREAVHGDITRHDKYSC